MSYLDQLSDKVWQFRYGQVKARLDKVCNADALWESWAKIIINTLDIGKGYVSIKNRIDAGVMAKINQDPYYQGQVWKFKDDLRVWFKSFNQKYDLTPTAQVDFNRDKDDYRINNEIMIYIDINQNMVDLLRLKE